MPRWFIVSGLAVILVAFLALVFVIGSLGGPPAGSLDQEQPQADQAESLAPNEETTLEEEPTSGEQPSLGEQTTQQDGRNAPLQTATVRITGDAEYQCSLGLIGVSRTVEGRAPASYTFRVVRGGTSLDTVMAVCQKISGDELEARILYGGEVKAQGSTTARFGTVDVSWSPVQEG